MLVFSLNPQICHKNEEYDRVRRKEEKIYWRQNYKAAPFAIDVQWFLTLTLNIMWGWWEYKMVHSILDCSLVVLEVRTCDPAIPPLGINPRELKISVCTKTCTWTFIALSIIAKPDNPNVRQLMMDKQNVGCTYDGILFCHKKEWSTATCYNMVNLESILLPERSQSEEITNSLISVMWNIQDRQIHRDRK